MLLGFASWLVSTALFLWMTPVVLGLGLSIPLAAFTGRRGPGAALQRAGLLGTPEERSPPPALAALRQLQDEYAAPLGDPVARLLADPAFLASHLAMLPPPRGRGDPFDPALLLGRAKLDEAATLTDGLAALTRAELLAVLGDAAAIRQLEALPHHA